MASLVRLPAYQVPENAMWNFKPVSDAVEYYNKGAEATRQFNVRQDIGNAMAGGRYSEAADAAAKAGELDTSLGIQKFGLDKQKLEADARRQQIAEMAGTAQRIAQIPDPAARDAEWQKFVMRPGVADSLTKNGFNPADVVASSQFIVDSARGYQDPLDVQKSQAQVNLLNQQAALAKAQAEQGGKSEFLTKYNAYAQQELAAGRQPKSMEEYEKGLRSAGATAISIDQKGEGAFAKKAGDLQAEDYTALVKRGRDAKGMTSDLSALRDIASRITTGKTAEITAQLGPWAEALGIKVEGLGDLQAYKAITSRLAPRMRVPGSGATSDFEMRTFLDALPDLGRTPEGNAIVANVLQAIQNNDIRAAEIAGRALAGEIGAKDAERLLRELPDPFTAWKQARGEGPSARPADGWQVIDGVRIRVQPQGGQDR